MQLSIALRLFFSIILIIPVFCAKAQQPTSGATDSRRDTDVIFNPLRKHKPEKTYHPDSTHQPLKAVLLSAVIPGWGQVYNKHLWKVPLIYAGLTSFAIGITYNHRNYVRDLRLYYYYFNPSKVTDKTPDHVYFNELLRGHVTQAQVLDAVNGFQRDFQLCILGFGGFWLIQVVEAYIDAKFIHSFSMDDMLGLKVSPALLSQPFYAANNNQVIVPGLHISLAF